MKAINPNATRDYVPECDRTLPEADQSVAEFTQLSADEQAYLKDIGSMQGTAINVALHLGLGGLRNFYDAEGNLIILKRDTAAKPVFGRKKPWANLTVIPMKERDEFAAEIIKGAQLGEPEVKNS